MIKAVWRICCLMATSAMGYENKENGFPTRDSKPVFMVHGLMVSSSDLAIVETLIKLTWLYRKENETAPLTIKSIIYTNPIMISVVFAMFLTVEKTKIIMRNPLTVVHNTNAYSYEASTIPLQEQLDGTLGQEFLNFSNTYPNGIHLIGHSQGALLARTLLQNYPQHNVCNFISICGPHAGQYGVPTYITALTSLGELPPLVDTASAIFYTDKAQKKLSIANFWNDPTQPELYLRYNTFLPYYNNEIWTKRSMCYREAILKLDNFITLLGPDDGIIEPWGSADFSFYDRCKKVVNITKRQIYTEDRLGLRTLHEKGRLIRSIVPDVFHGDFIHNIEVIKKYILPWLN